MIELKRQTADNPGFTLIEVIVSMTLIAILGVAAAIGLVEVVKGYVFARQNTETVQKVQIAMTRTIKELAAATSINSTTSTSVGYTRPTSVVDSTPVSNSIALSGSTILITGTSPAFPASVLINNVSAFALTPDNATLTRIRRIDINLSVTGADSVVSSFTNSVSVQESFW
ncbi:MAG: prepilin-type N-terminal cleavage/methylation domain-containing protein [Syntrophales bacterium LBB04]|nr:prepilin-type N-terminal cleavage/methylation domain-containing protein [Syntrophales bacterium LBB04]